MRTMKTRRRVRAVTLLELIVVCGIITFSLTATLRVIGSVQSLRERSKDLTALSLRANAELERLKVQPFDEIQPGKRSLASLPDRQTGEIVVSDIHPGTLKQITVTLRATSAKDNAEVSVTTLLAKPVAR
jgi:type II secretory pathway pseudopilin PulG